MLKKHINKFLIVLLCFALLPLSLFNSSVALASDVETVYFGAKYMYYTNDSIKDSSSNQVQISVKTTNGTDDVVIYEEGKQKDVQSQVASIAYSNGHITILFSQEGNFTVTTKIKDKDEDEYKHEKLFTVTKNLSLCSAPSYITDVTKINEYQEKASNATYEDGDTTKTPLYLGDKYEVPSIAEIVNAGSLGYNMYTKYLMVATPGSQGYTQKSSVSMTNTTTQLSFNVDSAGIYRYYITLESDEIDGENRLSLNADGLVEMVKGDNSFAIYDGFYRAYKGDEELIATKTVNNEYTFALKSNKEKVEKDDVTKYELVIPTFTFEIIGRNAPKATYKNKVQENGYVGLTYTIGAFEVKGYKTQENYVLKYKENKDDSEWTVIEDGFNSAGMSFVPDKVGYYKVTLEIVDGYDNEVTVDSLVISVLSEPVYPKYKTSFADWISVNTMPFVCLCVSFVCLVGIVCLIFIKPKKKTIKVNEEDR